jgi:hypothetical protein
LIILNKSYIKMRYVPIITSLLNQMRYVPLITNLINETVINIYYIHYHLHIIIYLLHIINKMNQTSNHMDTKIFLRGNPVTGEKTTEASLTSKFTSPGLNTGWGNNPLQST